MLTFEPEGHVYTLDGAPVRSVTNLLRTVGLIDFSAIPPSVLAAAQLRGTTVHQALHFYNEQDLDVERFARDFPDYAGYLHSWMALCGSGRLETVACEQRVANRSPRYAGTLDWLGRLDGEPALLDFATGDPQDAAKHLQTAAYVLALFAWREELDAAPWRALVGTTAPLRRFGVQLDRTGALPALHPYTDPRDYRVVRLIAETVNAVDGERAKRRPVEAWSWGD